MLKNVVVSCIFSALGSVIHAGTTYKETSIINVPNIYPDKPIISKGSQIYRIESDSLFIRRGDGSEYFYNTLIETKDKLRFTCGNKYVVFLDQSKDKMIVGHIDEIESTIIYLKKIGK